MTYFPIPKQFKASAEPTGFLNRTDSSIAAAMDGADIDMTITGTDFEIYSEGKKYLKDTETYTITSPVTGSLYYVYYNGADASLAITHGTDFWDLSEDVPICTIYYDGTGPLLGDERHGITMDWATHAYLHRTVGTRYSSGLAGTFDSTTLTIAEGDLYDEDLLIDIPETTTCRVIYRSGSDFVADVEGTLYYKAPAGVLKYDNAGSLASVTNNYYCAAWIFGTNDPDCPIYAIVGQREDQKIADARASNVYESLTLGTLPFAEMKVLFRVILKNDGGSPTYVETLDLRSISNLPGGTYVATDHGSLSGLADPDHPETALSLSDNTTNNVSIAQHGFCPKAPNDTSKFLRGDATWNAPAGTGAAFPVGSIFIAVVDTDPATLLGYGTWAAFGAGKVLIGLDSGDAAFDTVKETGGAKTSTPDAHAGTAVDNHANHVHSGSADHSSHTHTYTEVPNHVHPENVPSSASGGAVKIALDTNASGSTDAGISTANPTGGVASGTTAGPSATLTHGNTGNETAALTHSVTQPSAHAAMSIVQPYIVVYMWERTA